MLWLWLWWDGSRRRRLPFERRRRCRSCSAARARAPLPATAAHATTKLNVQAWGKALGSPTPGQLCTSSSLHPRPITLSTDLDETLENLILDQLDVSAYGPELLDPEAELDHIFD